MQRDGPVHVLLRPERVRLLEAGSAPPDVSVVTLKVGAVTHFGESTLLTGTAGAQPLRVRVSAEGARNVRAGDEVLVGWRPRDLHLIDPASAAGPRTG